MPVRPPVKTHKGYLLGRRWQESEIAELCHTVGWRGEDLVRAVAVCLSESAGYEKARCDNLVDGVPVSSDYGLFQINMPQPHPDVYDPMWNAHRAYRMWYTRGWQPWYGYTNNIALNPEMRGKYIQRAIWGVMNFTRRQYGMKGVPSPYILEGKRRLTYWLEHPETKS